MNSRDIIAQLKAAGWVLNRVKGSHHTFVHPNKPGHVVVVHPRKDCPIGTLKNMERQAGMKFK